LDVDRAGNIIDRRALTAEQDENIAAAPYTGGISMGQRPAGHPLGGKAVGAIWALRHGDDRKFDAKDEPLMRALGKVAPRAYQTLVDNLKKG
jgi:hypothetical protein